MKVLVAYRRKRGTQQGYALMVILLMMFLLMVSLVAVAPRMKQRIQREREEETIHRGQQYVRAIRRFYRKFGRYPTTLEELENTNNIRFLRKKYKDPLAPDGSWRIIHFGEAKVVPKQLQVASGATAGPGTAGLGPGGMMSAPVGGAFAMQQQQQQQPQAQAVDENGNPIANPGGPGSPQGQQPGGAQGSETGNVGTPVSSKGTLGGKTFGGGAIVGVAPNSKEKSIKVINDKDHYNDWEFVYDPRLDIVNQISAAGATGLQPAGQQVQPGNTGIGNFGNMGPMGGPQQQPQTPPQNTGGVNPR